MLSRYLLSVAKNSQSSLPTWYVLIPSGMAFEKRLSTQPSPRKSQQENIYIYIQCMYIYIYTVSGHIYIYSVYIYICVSSIFYQQHLNHRGALISTNP